VSEGSVSEPVPPAGPAHPGDHLVSGPGCVDKIPAFSAQSLSPFPGEYLYPRIDLFQRAYPLKSQKHPVWDVLQDFQAGYQDYSGDLFDPGDFQSHS
jgi:hypothetical protein